MIRIEPSDFNERLCNHCCSKHDVKIVTIRYVGTNSGTQIALCRECREVLLEELKNS